MALAIHNWSLLSIVTRVFLICIEFLWPWRLVIGLLPFPLGKSIVPNCHSRTILEDCSAPFLYVPSQRRRLNGPKVLREPRWGRVTRCDESPHVPNRCPQIAARLLEDVFKHTMKTSLYVSEALAAVSIINFDLKGGVFGSIFCIGSLPFLSHGIFQGSRFVPKESQGPSANSRRPLFGFLLTDSKSS